MQLTVCICTYNRETLLAKCLESLRLQSADAERFQVLVVDNAGTESCQQVATDFSVTYVHEKRTGLSHARNRGYQEAATEWLLYLDDDAIARPDLIERLLKHIDSQHWVAIGGRFEHYFEQPPSNWLKLEVGLGYEPYPGVKELIELPSEASLVGGVMAFSVATLVQHGGFNPGFGMNGNAFGYGEEDELQQRIRAASGRIAYDPQMVIDHLYHPRKQTLKAQQSMIFKSGIAHGKMGNTGAANVVILYLEYARNVCYYLPFTLVKWLIKRRDWHWQNAWLAFSSHLYFAKGAYLGRRDANKDRRPKNNV